MWNADGLGRKSGWKETLVAVAWVFLDAFRCWSHGRIDTRQPFVEKFELARDKHLRRKARVQNLPSGENPVEPLYYQPKPGK